MSQGNRVFIIGVGMTRFARCDRDARELGQEAATAALKDAGIDYEKIEQGFCGYINGMSTLGQQTLYGVLRTDEDWPRSEEGTQRKVAKAQRRKGFAPIPWP